MILRKIVFLNFDMPFFFRVSSFYGSPRGNQVDRLPSVRHTEAVWGAHGVFGPAPIYKLDQKMYEIKQKCYRKLYRSFVQFEVCI